MRYLFVLVILPVFLSAQNDRYEDPLARTMLEEIKSKIDAAPNLRYAFTLTVDPAEDEPIEQIGNYWQQGNSYRLDLPEYLFLSNGTSLWVVDKTAEEIQIHDYTTPDPDELTHPQNLLHIYDNPNFKYRLVDDRSVEFYPMDRDFEYFKALLKTSDKTEMESIQVWSKDGTRYEVSISAEEKGLDLTSAFFDLDKSKYPGFHIEDLRID